MEKAPITTSLLREKKRAKVKAKFTKGVIKPFGVLGLKEGDELELIYQKVKKTDKKLLSEIKRKMETQEGLNKGERKIAIQAGLIDKDQEWFWTPEWQAGEKKADEDERLGRVSGPFDTAEEAVAHLNGLIKKP
jgi:predicted DNA-binding antitoxin AbrB/MazE fold protein